MAQSALGSVTAAAADWVGARSLYAAGLERLRPAGDKRAIAQALAGLGDAALHLRDAAPAEAAFAEALTLFRALGVQRGVRLSLAGLARVGRRRAGDRPQAVALRRAARPVPNLPAPSSSRWRAEDGRDGTSRSARRLRSRPARAGSKSRGPATTACGGHRAPGGAGR